MARTLTQPGPERANRLIFTGAVAFAAVAAILIFVALSNFGGSSKSSGAPAGDVSVVVASRDISAGTKLSSDMLEVRTISSNAEIAGAFTDKSAAVGLTTRVGLAKGEQLSGAKLGQTAKDKTFSDVIPQGKRAIAVSVDEKRIVGGLVVAGDHVDVVVIGKKKTVNKDDPTSDLPTAFTLLQDVEVLSVSDTALKPTASLDKDGNPINSNTAAGSTGTRPDSTDPAPTAKSVTLSVNPEDEGLVALASESYTVYLVLRPNGDPSKIQNPSDLIILPQVQ